MTKFLNLLIFSLVANLLLAQNATKGNWGDVINTDMVPVAAANTPDGKIVTWSSYDEIGYSTNVNHGQTYVSVYDPQSNSFSTTIVANTGHDMFCPGTANLRDGRVMITGGAANAITTFYNPASNTFSKGPDMIVDRGYHAMCTLTDGKVFAIGGSWSRKADRVAEIWDEVSGWIGLPNITSNNSIRQGAGDVGGIYREDNHAWLFAVPGNNVFQLGPATDIHYFTTSGDGQVFDKGTRADDPYSMNGTATMYDQAKVLTVGGASTYSSSSPASKNTHILTLSGDDVSAVKSGDLNIARTLHNATVLPNGEVVVTGGTAKSTLFSDEDAIMPAEIWNPSTGEWTILESMDVPRTYHSVAILMKDGRIFTGGGGLCREGCDVNHLDAQYFYPPYLYNSRGNLATQPVLSNVPPDTDYNKSITVQSSQTIDNFVLMRLSSVTHSLNVEQRRIPVSSSANGGNNYTVNIPNSDWLPPGDYWLFGMNNSGVPSIGETIRIGGAPADVADFEVITGTYFIQNVGNMQNAEQQGTNINMANASTSNSQKWIFKHLGDGVHTIENGVGGFLRVNGSACANSSNINTAVSSSADNERWIIKKVGSAYFFHPVHCQSHAMDKNRNDDNNVHLFKLSLTNANQKWNLIPASDIDIDIDADADFEVITGTYFIQNVGNMQNAEQQGTNVNMANASTSNSQKWIFKHLGDGVHTIENGVGGFLRVNGSACANSSNINTAVSSSADNERWIIKKVGSAYFFHPVHCQSHAMDKNRNDDNNVHLFKLSLTNANQKWNLIPASDIDIDIDIDADADFEVITGTYYIQNVGNKQNAAQQGTNVNMVNANTSNSQKWTFRHLGEGVHTMENGNGRYLKVNSSVCNNSTNINTAVNTNGDNKRWIIKKVGSDYFLHPVHCQSHVMDKNRNNNNTVHLYKFSLTNANQKWKFISTSSASSRSASTAAFSANIEYGNKVELDWEHYNGDPNKTVKSYTFMRYDFDAQDFVDLVIFDDPFMTENLANKTYIHYHPNIGDNYYKVKIDYSDNSVEYSNEQYAFVQDLGQNINLNLSPNPAQSFVKVNLSSYMGKQVNYTITDLKGTVLSEGEIDNNHADATEINVSNFQNGHYIMTISTDGLKRVSQQFIVMKNY